MTGRARTRVDSKWDSLLVPAVMLIAIPWLLAVIAWDWARDGFPLRRGPSIDPAKAPDAYGARNRGWVGQIECEVKHSERERQGS